MSRGTIELGSKTIPDTKAQGYIVTPIGDFGHEHVWDDWKQQGTPIAPIPKRWHRRCISCREYESIEYYPEERTHGH